VGIGHKWQAQLRSDDGVKKSLPYISRYLQINPTVVGPNG
jgi:hypothetical protein